MAIRESAFGKGLVRKALSVPLSVVLAVGLAPAPAFAGEMTTTSLQGASLSAASTSLYSQYLPVLFHAANGMDEFEGDYQACGASQWAPQYFLFDVGNDGVPELFVRTTSFGGNKVVHAFTVKSDKLVSLGSYLEGSFGTAGNSNGKLFVAGWDGENSYVNLLRIAGDAITSKFVKSGKATASNPSGHVQVVTDYLNGQNASWLSSGSVSDYSDLKNEGKYSIAKAKVAVASGGSYTGAAKSPKVTVTFGGATLKQGTDYSVTYKNNKNAGTATAVITGKGNYKDSCSGSFTIAKAVNPMVLKAAAKTFALAKVAKAAQTYKPITFRKAAQGKVTYKSASATAVAKKLTVNASTGAVTVKKGTAKGSYAVKVKVTAAGNANYKPLSTTVGFTVTVK